MTGRRVRLVPVSSDLLQLMFGGHGWTKLTSDWPDDARVEDMRWGFEHRRIELLVHSESFDEVDEGVFAPEWDPTFKVEYLDPVLEKMFEKTRQEMELDAAIRAIRKA